MENFGPFAIFGVNLRHFHSKQCNSLQKRLLDNQLFPCCSFKTFHSTKAVERITKLHKSFINRKFWVFFVIFGVNLRHFHLGNCNKVCWTTHFVLVDPFQRSNPQSQSEIWKKVPKIFENNKSLEFLSISGSI